LCEKEIRFILLLLFILTANGFLPGGSVNANLMLKQMVCTFITVCEGVKMDQGMDCENTLRRWKICFMTMSADKHWY
jgi:hypothetical protein